MRGARSNRNQFAMLMQEALPVRRNYDDQVESRTVCIVRLERIVEVRNTMLRRGRNRHERED